MLNQLDFRHFQVLLQVYMLIFTKTLNHSIFLKHLIKRFFFLSNMSQINHYMGKKDTLVDIRMHVETMLLNYDNLFTMSWIFIGTACYSKQANVKNSCVSCAWWSSYPVNFKHLLEVNMWKNCKGTWNRYKNCNCIITKRLLECPFLSHFWNKSNLVFNLL